MISKTRGVSILEILVTLAISAIVLVLFISAIFGSLVSGLVLLFLFLIVNIIVIGRIIKYVKQIVWLKPNVFTINNESDNPINQIPQSPTKFPFSEILMILFYWFIAVVLGIGGIINWMLEFIFTILTGWIIFIVNRIPIVLENQLLIWWGIIYFIGFIITAHVFLSWLYQQWHKPAHTDSEPTAIANLNTGWRFNWSLWLGLGIITLFSNAIAVSGLIHQIGWLLNTDDPFVMNISLGYDQVRYNNNLDQLYLVQVPVNDFYAVHGRLPLDNAAAGLPEPASVADNFEFHYVSSVEIINGKITVTYDGKKAGYILQGKTIDIVPWLNKNGSLEWVCGNAKPPAGATKIPNVPENNSTMETHFMPDQCRP